MNKNDGDKIFNESDNWSKVLKIKDVIVNTVCQLRTKAMLFQDNQTIGATKFLKSKKSIREYFR